MGIAPITADPKSLPPTCTMALSMKSAVAMPAAKVSMPVRARRSVVCMADMSAAKKVAQAATVGVASLALTLGANAATVKLGCARGAAVH